MNRLEFAAALSKVESVPNKTKLRKLASELSNRPTVARKHSGISHWTPRDQQRSYWLGGRSLEDFITDGVQTCKLLAIIRKRLINEFDVPIGKLPLYMQGIITILDVDAHFSANPQLKVKDTK